MNLIIAAEKNVQNLLRLLLDAEEELVAGSSQTKHLATDGKLTNGLVPSRFVIVILRKTNDTNNIFKSTNFINNITCETLETYMLLWKKTDEKP